jgi:hypothetical protein
VVKFRDPPEEEGTIAVDSHPIKANRRIAGGGEAAGYVIGFCQHRHG